MIFIMLRLVYINLIFLYNLILIIFCQSVRQSQIQNSSFLAAVLNLLPSSVGERECVCVCFSWVFFSPFVSFVLYRPMLFYFILLSYSVLSLNIFVFEFLFLLMV